MNYPVNCKKCNQPLYGPVRYCPFCGADTISATSAPIEKKKEKVKTPIPENVVVITPPIQKAEPKPKVMPPPPVEEEEVEEVIEDFSTEKKDEIIDVPRPKPLFWKVAIVIGLIVIVAGVFIANEGDKEPPPPPPLASLTIKSQPDGAVVYLNGAWKGNSPLTINDLKKENYTVRLELNGYKPKEEHITLGQERQRLDVKLVKLEIPQKGAEPEQFPIQGDDTPLQQPEVRDLEPPVLDKPIPTVSEPEVRNFNIAVMDLNNRPVASIKEGQTIYLLSEYTIVASPNVNMVAVEENNYLVMPDGSTRTPDTIRTKQRGVGMIEAAISITLPKGIQPGIYTHVATVRVGDVINKAEQRIRVESESPSINTAAQQEIDTYLAEGKIFFQKGEFKICISKMEEVLKRDRNKYEAERYIRMAQDELEKINNQFQNPNVGRAR